MVMELNFVSVLKYLVWYIIVADTLRLGLHHVHVHFFYSFNSTYAKSNLSEAVLQ